MFTQENRSNHYIFLQDKKTFIYKLNAKKVTATHFPLGLVFLHVNPDSTLKGGKPDL